MEKIEELEASGVILRILARSGRAIPSTKLVKLTYLVDYLHYQHHGRTLTGFQYMWDHFGPNAIGHAIVAEAQELVVAEQAAMYCDSNVHGSQTNYYKVAPGISVMPLPGYAEMLVDDIVRQYGGLSIEDITEVTKQTKPFKSLSHRLVGELSDTGVGGMRLNRGWPVQFHRPLVDPQKGRLLS